LRRGNAAANVAGRASSRAVCGEGRRKDTGLTGGSTAVRGHIPDRFFHIHVAVGSATAYLATMNEDKAPADPLDVAEASPVREPVFNLAGVVVGIVAICVGIHLVRMFLLSQQQDVWVILRFAFFPARYSGGYDLDFYAFLAPVTYSLLHGSVAHLGVNLIWLAAFGSPLANRLGTARFLAFWVATSLGAVLLHFALYPTDMTPLVGASGAISGMMGAAARFAFCIDRVSGRPAFAGPVLGMRDVFRSRQAMAFLAVWMIVNLATGLGLGTSGMEGQIAWEAHIGGFLVGFFGLRLFDAGNPHTS